MNLCWEDQVWHCGQKAHLIGNCKYVTAEHSRLAKNIVVGVTLSECSAHTYEQTNSSLDWVLSHWAHFTVLRFIFVCVYYFVSDYILNACVLGSIVTW